MLGHASIDTAARYFRSGSAENAASSSASSINDWPDDHDGAGDSDLGDPGTKTRNTLLRSLRYQGERGFALMSQRWRALQHVMISPTTIGDIAKSVLVLVQFEHKMIS